MFSNLHYEILTENYHLTTTDAEVECQIEASVSTGEMEERYFQEAQKFREQGRFQLAQTVLHSLTVYSNNPEIKTAARKAYRQNLQDFDRYVVLSHELNPYDIDYEFNHTQGSAYCAAKTAELRKVAEAALVREICAALEANVEVIEIPLCVSEPIDLVECFVTS